MGGFEDQLKQSVSAQIDFIMDPLNAVLDVLGYTFMLVQLIGKAEDLLLCSLVKPPLQILNTVVMNSGGLKSTVLYI